MGARPEAVTLVRNRIALAAALCAAAFGLVGARLADVMVFHAGAPVTQTAIAAHPMRADLVDRNGLLIARDLPVSDLYASPKSFWDAGEAAHALARVTGADEAKLRAAFAAKKGYVLVQRALSPDMRDAVMHLGLPGLTFEERYKRFYPSGRTIAHAIGQVDADDKGVSGLELGLNAKIKGGQAPVALSFDMRVQYALQHEIAATAEAFHTIAAGGIVMNVRTGEVLALASFPDYEPNSRVLGAGDSIRNRMTQDVYELGSIFKIFAFSEALEEHTVTLDDTFEVGKPYKLSRFYIHDFERLGPILTAAQVFAESSNIGTAQIELRSGPTKQRPFLARMGLLNPVRTEVPETAAPLYPRRWGDVEAATISFGHGISVNPLAFVAAAASVVNGGTRLRPTFLKSPTVQHGDRVVSEETSLTMRRLMRMVVIDEHGTGRMAAVPGYDIGGKTGTAEKPVNGRYSRNRQITSFVGVFPIADPEYLVFAMFDEPKGNKASFGFATAGWTAAPTVGRVIARIAPLLGVPRNDTIAESQAIAVSAP